MKLNCSSVTSFLCPLQLGAIILKQIPWFVYFHYYTLFCCVAHSFSLLWLDVELHFSFKQKKGML